MACLVPDCGRQVAARGLCSRHHNVANRLIQAGLVSDAALVAAGKMRARHAMGRQAVRDAAQDWFLAGLTDPADRY